MVEFSLDADSGRVVVKIIDSATQEVVRQIPMEEMLALAKALDKFQGLLLHTKA
jgi:flagellar protein FlaG